MVCYAVPLIAAGLGFGWRGAFGRSSVHPQQEQWLRLMLLGASTFGVVDHFWNGELMLIGDNIATDIALGCAITLSVFVAWGLVAAAQSLSARNPAPAGV